jgi:hypothetical protein
MSKIYRVRGIDLDHDGKRYPEGAEVTLDDAAAARLQRFLEPEDRGQKTEDRKVSSSQESVSSNQPGTDDGTQTTKAAPAAAQSSVISPQSSGKKGAKP